MLKDKEQTTVQYGAENAIPVEDPGHCTAEQWMRISDFEGCIKILPARCYQCAGCGHAWRSKVKKRIADGVNRHGKAGAMFLTLTLDGRLETRTTERIIKAWRKFRRSSWFRRRYGATPFYRVIELHRDGAAHMHMVIYGIPKILKANNRESIRSFISRQSTEAKEFIHKLRENSFGPISHSEKLRGSGAAAAAYLAKYLGKTDRPTITRRGVTFHRIADCSKGWGTPRIHSNHFWLQARQATEGEAQTITTTTGCGSEANHPLEIAVQRQERQRHIRMPDPKAFIMIPFITRWRQRIYTKRQKILDWAFEEDPTGRVPLRQMHQGQIWDKLQDELDALTAMFQRLVSNYSASLTICLTSGITICPYHLPKD